MKLDRNNPTGVGKYIVVNTRKFDFVPSTVEELIAQLTAHPEAVEFGTPGSADEFFVLKLKDAYAEAPIRLYGNSVQSFDREYAEAVLDLADRSGAHSPWFKNPD